MAYLHGTGDAEQSRLAAMNELINGPCLRELGLTTGLRVLDVGAGSAQMARAMARAVGPGGHVLAIERDARQRELALRLAADAGENGLVELREGDATSLPLRGDEAGSFDVAVARFVLEHVADPLDVVSEMVRALRPGGRVVLLDDCHSILRLHPRCAPFRSLWDAYARSYAFLGCDADVGVRLPELLVRGGATPSRITSVFYGACAGQPEFAAIVRNAAGVVRSVRDRMLSEGLVTRHAFDEGLAALEAWSAEPGAAFWYSILWAEGIRP